MWNEKWNHLFGNREVLSSRFISIRSWDINLRFVCYGNLMARHHTCIMTYWENVIYFRNYQTESRETYPVYTSCGSLTVTNMRCFEWFRLTIAKYITFFNKSLCTCDVKGLNFQYQAANLNISGTKWGMGKL